MSFDSVPGVCLRIQLQFSHFLKLGKYSADSLHAGEMLASAGDDGNVLLWVPSELGAAHSIAMGEDHSDDKEIWRVKHMCRSSGAEIYDLAWSPDGVYFITGSMDNVARIYNAQTGRCINMTY